MEPLPPVKEVEYRCYISKIFEELSGSEYMTFAFETAKEFSSFRYEIAVRYRIQPGLLEFKVLGMTATRTMMPAFGTARSVLKIPLLPFGVYTLKLIKSDGVESVFVIEVTKRGFQILQPIPRKRFIDLVIEPKAAMPGARHTSTVSKAPNVPLVPRTIQKRQLPGEELLEDLESDSHEDHEQLEEAELFGSEQPVASEHAAKAHGSKPGAKHSVEEVKEVPASVKHNGEVSPKSAKAPAKKVEEKPAKKAEHKPAKPAKKPAAKPLKHSAPAKKVAAKKPAAKAKPKAKPAAKKSGKKK